MDAFADDGKESLIVGLREAILNVNAWCVLSRGVAPTLRVRVPARACVIPSLCVCVCVCVCVCGVCVCVCVCMCVCMCGCA